MSNGSFSLGKFYKDSKQTIFRPKTYFPDMEVSGGLGEPILKALSYGVIAGIFILIWSLLDIIGITTGSYSGNDAVIGFFSTIGGAVVGVFIAALIIMILSYICSGNKNYEANMRVAAAIMVVLPVSVILGVFSGISYALGAVIALIVHLYGVYMLYNALVSTLKGDKKPARAISYILGVLLVIVAIIGLV